MFLLLLSKWGLCLNVYGAIAVPAIYVDFMKSTPAQLLNRYKHVYERLTDCGTSEIISTNRCTAYDPNVIWFIEANPDLMRPHNR